MMGAMIDSTTERITTIDDARLVELVQDLGVTKTAKHLKCRHSSVREAIKKLGIEVKPGRPRSQEARDIEICALQHSTSSDNVAKMFDISMSRVNQIWTGPTVSRVMEQLKTKTPAETAKHFGVKVAMIRTLMKHHQA